MTTARTVHVFVTGPTGAPVMVGVCPRVVDSEELVSMDDCATVIAARLGDTVLHAVNIPTFILSNSIPHVRIPSDVREWRDHDSNTTITHHRDDYFVRLEHLAQLVDAAVAIEMQWAVRSMRRGDR
jgi:hypothetical protein